MVVKNGTKKTFEGFLNVLNVLNMSHGNGSSAFVFQVTGILKPVTDSTDKILQLSHSHMVWCHSLYGSNFDFCMTYFENLKLKAASCICLWVGLCVTFFLKISKISNPLIGHG